MTELLRNIFAIEAPEDAKEFVIEEGKLRYFFLTYEPTIDLPPGSYEIMFGTKGVSEEDAAGVVEYDPLGEGWEHYMSDEEARRHDRIELLPSAIDSLTALLKSKGLTAGNYLIIKKVA